jgi:DNA-binding HxlR family transcriptional regulator
MENKVVPTAFCPTFHKAVELIGKRWTGAIIRAMRSGRVRFSDISDAIPGLHDRLLSERLKELDQEGLVERVVIPETPVRIEYHLTPKGQDLDSVMDAVSLWAERWVTVTPEDVTRHTACAEVEKAACAEAEQDAILVP